MLKVLHHIRKLKMNLKRVQCDFRKIIFVAPEQYVGDNMFEVDERIKLEERKSLVEIFFPSFFQINSMHHLPD